MWNRALMKNAGNKAFRKGYWFCVLTAFAAAALTFVAVSVISGVPQWAGGIHWNIRFPNLQSTDGYTFDTARLFATPLLAGFAALATLSSVFRLAVYVAVDLPFRVSSACFFMKNREPEKTTLAGWKAGFSKSYGHVLISMLLRDIFTILLSFLFLIPGIIYSYSQFALPYILAENPNLSRKDAAKLSKIMMKGNKWHLFVLDLSFIGWKLLDVLTGGILGIFYVNPYLYATYAEVYTFLRTVVLARGLVAPEVLPGFENAHSQPEAAANPEASQENPEAQPAPEEECPGAEVIEMPSAEVPESDTPENNE